MKIIIPTRHLARSIDRYLARDANYLLNVGPTGEGVFPEESAGILKRLGKWYYSVKESFEKVDTVPDLIVNRDALITRRDNTYYIHFYKGLTGNGFKLKPVNILPEKSILLNDGRLVECVVNLSPSDHLEQKPYLRLRNLPANEMSDTVMVVKLEFKNPLI